MTCGKRSVTINQSTNTLNFSKLYSEVKKIDESTYKIYGAMQSGISANYPVEASVPAADFTSVERRIVEQMNTAAKNKTYRLLYALRWLRSEDYGAITKPRCL